MRSPNGFKPSMRIRSSRDFSRAYAQGSRARGDIMIVVARANGLGHARLGLSVGRKVWRRAVRRNRVRRIFREAFRLSYGELPAGHDLVLIPAQAELEPRLEATRRELVQMARKAARRFAEKEAQRKEHADEEPAP